MRCNRSLDFCILQIFKMKILSKIDPKITNFMTSFQDSFQIHTFLFYILFKLYLAPANHYNKHIISWMCLYMVPSITNKNILRPVASAMFYLARYILDYFWLKLWLIPIFRTILGQGTWLWHNFKDFSARSYSRSH